jgi:hypothetical protein
MISIERIGKDQDKFLNSIKKGDEIWCCENNLEKTIRKIFRNESIIKNKK